MVTMAQSAANWHNTHTHMDHTHSLTHFRQHSYNHIMWSASSAITECGVKAALTLPPTVLMRENSFPEEMVSVSSSKPVAAVGNTGVVIVSSIAMFTHTQRIFVGFKLQCHQTKGSNKAQSHNFKNDVWLILHWLYIGSSAMVNKKHNWKEYFPGKIFKNTDE